MAEHTLTFDDLQKDTEVEGIVPGRVVKIVVVQPAHAPAPAPADTASDPAPAPATATVIYTDPDGKLGSELLTAARLADLRIVRKANAAPAFDGDPTAFRLASEALRIRNAAAYDPMSAVYSSSIAPLPHQIRAVYEDMLPKVPLRFLLADDPGAGKTIMAGLYIREMLLRSAAERVIIVCPGGLAEQWQDEMQSKFSLDFDIFSPAMVAASPSGNPFREARLLIVRMDQVARNDEFSAMLRDPDVRWDIAVVDEAHRMSAHYRNAYDEMDRTRRFALGQTLSQTSENLLLMTATPHSGNEADFQLFLTLLDKDRFAGQPRGQHSHQHIDTKDVMRRMVKEEMLDFDGHHLFPERRAETVRYPLSPDEASLYRAVTDYVRSGMNKAQNIMSTDKRRGNSIGFALTVLQRRLASSPEAIYRSLVRRRDRLQMLLEAIDRNPHDIARLLAAPSGNGSAPGSTSAPNFDDFSDLNDYDDAWDEASEDSQGVFENGADAIVDSATAARTREELKAEVATLNILVSQARTLRDSGNDTKWRQLSDILQERILDTGTSDMPHKMIVFTEHRDTLNYLERNIANLLGRPEAVCTIHGGLSRDQRKTVQERFVNNPECRILVATDAAGEGLNLQRADLMVNYDLPWNPNRIEQRFGRIHRIGQKRMCFLWNMVAAHTREGDVYTRLLSKIDTMDKAYNGRLFNVLGDSKAFEGRSLSDLMVQAIQRGDSPEAQQWLDTVIDAGVTDGLQKLKQEESVDRESFLHLTGADVDAERRRMEQHRERKLQPGYIEAFFVEAILNLGGSISRRETGRWEILRMPQEVLRAAEQLNRHRPLANRYERVTFDPAHVDDARNQTKALLVTPGTPILNAVIAVVLRKYAGELAKGTIFVDDTDSQNERPAIVTAASQDISASALGPRHKGDSEVIARQFDYLQVEDNGDMQTLAVPPYADFRAPTDAERRQIDAIRADEWFAIDHSQELCDYVYATCTAKRVAQLQAAHDAERAHVWERVKQRLDSESNYWWGEYLRIQESERTQPGKKQPMSSAAAYKRAQEMDARLEEREAALAGPDHLHVSPVRLHGLALVIPASLLAHDGEGNDAADEGDEQLPAHMAKETEEVDSRGMELTMEAERRLGREPHEMPHNNKGYDIESYDAHGAKIIIEVKSKIDLPGHDYFFATPSEIMMAKTQGDHHRLALALISPDGPEHDRIRYVAHAFDRIVPDETIADAKIYFSKHWNNGSDPF
ncbi:helicase-related protein [Pseudoscardovia radai]|uniref:helicase-related protein n=1 Tax=Pseudoscardovia radai TaxID=987066 RepID=UPI003993B81E